MPTFKHFLEKTHQKIKHIQGKVAASLAKRNEVPVEVSPVAPKTEKKQKMEMMVSSRTMARFVAITLLLLLAAAFLYEIKDILVIFFVSLLFAAALDPMVDALERRKIPRGVGVVIIYLVILFVLGFLISNLVPLIANEVSQLASKIQDWIGNFVKGDIILPKFMERFRPDIKNWLGDVDISQFGTYKDVLLKVAQQLSSVAGNVFNALLVVFNGFFNAILVLVLTFMMTVDEASIDKFILSLFSSRHSEYIRHKSNLIKEKMGDWLRGQIILCVVIGVCVYIGFFIIGLFTAKVEYAATMALVAGITEIIPYAGPFLAWLIALPIVANQSPMLIVWMTILMYIVQTMENNLIVPFVMNKAVGISPIFVMFAMFVGFEFLGVLGMVLSIPVATAAALFLKDYSERSK
ncbi:AI-2E family transporter [Candidatus Peregrinibacteria bacterium]|nr:AI-2E family transporter [Candidatus Peregrinibacteria bacterium]